MRLTPCRVSIVLLAECCQPPASDPRIDAIVDRLSIEDAVNELFVATDIKEWDGIRAAFADRVLFSSI
jgi:hypothetical protein